MRSHRLNRLALLTQGVALVGLGISALACGDPPRVNAPPSEPPQVNSPPKEPPVASASATPSASSSAVTKGPPPTAPMHVNSPPMKPPPAPTKP